MQKHHIGKILAIGIIVLFIGVGIHPAFAGNSNKDYFEDEKDKIDKKYDYLIKQVTMSRVKLNNYWLKKDKLPTSFRAANDCFGWSVSLDGDYALIGADWDDDNGEDAGAAYIFKRFGSRWFKQYKLLASDGASDDRFGVSVSIDGDYAIIGADLNDDNGQYTGSAYIFKRNGDTWYEQKKLLGSDAAFYDFFGWSVSIDGDYAIIGAVFDDDNGYEAGAAYVFKRDGITWNEQQKLLASDGKSLDYFGHSVSIDGDHALIGAPSDLYHGFSSGSAYIFKREGITWSEQLKLTPSDGGTEDYFGASVSINGDYALIGTPCDNENGYWSGSAHVFKRDGTTWSKQAKLIPSDGKTKDIFGVSVSIGEDYAYIGAPDDYANGNDSGSAYVFKRDGTTWSEYQKIIPSDITANDHFANSVSLDGDYALIGAPWNHNKGNVSGSAYIFKLLGPIWVKQDKLIIPRFRSSTELNWLRFFDMFPILQKILSYIL